MKNKKFKIFEIFHFKKCLATTLCFNFGYVKVEINIARTENYPCFNQLSISQDLTIFLSDKTEIHVLCVFEMLLITGILIQYKNVYII